MPVLEAVPHHVARCLLPPGGSGARELRTGNGLPHGGEQGVVERSRGSLGFEITFYKISYPTYFGHYLGWRWRDDKVFSCEDVQKGFDRFEIFDKRQ